MRRETFHEKVSIFKFRTLPWHTIIALRRIKNKWSTERACSSSVRRYWSFKRRGASDDRSFFLFHYLWNTVRWI